MSQSRLYDDLGRLFPKTNKADWRKMASRELTSDDPEAKLLWRTNDGLKFFPYYDAADVASLSYLSYHAILPASNDAGGRSWLNLSPVDLTDHNAANASARQALSHGADGLLIDVTSPASVDLTTILAGIELSQCAVFFNSETTPDITNSIISFSQSYKDIPSGTGGVYWHGTPPGPVDIFNSTPAGPRFRSLGLYVEQSTPVAEIAGALTQSTLLMHQLTDAGVSPSVAIERLAFSLPADADFLVTIAKYKALRLLLHSWASAYGVDRPDIQVHARIGPGVVSGLEPHSNMFHGTVAGIAAILGGISSLSLFPEDSTQEMLRRISRNVSIILSEEAHLNKVADPTAGAYGLDVMTDNLAEHAWSAFQKMTTTA